MTVSGSSFSLPASEAPRVSGGESASTNSQSGVFFPHSSRRSSEDSSGSADPSEIDEHPQIAFNSTPCEEETSGTLQLPVTKFTARHQQALNRLSLGEEVREMMLLNLGFRKPASSVLREIDNQSLSFDRCIAVIHDLKATWSCASGAYQEQSGTAEAGGIAEAEISAGVGSHAPVIVLPIAIPNTRRQSLEYYHQPRSICSTATIVVMQSRHPVCGNQDSSASILLQHVEHAYRISWMLRAVQKCTRQALAPCKQCMWPAICLFQNAVVSQSDCAVHPQE